MDECPTCGVLCPVVSPTMDSADILHHCVECMVAWKPPRNNDGERVPFAYPKGAMMHRISLAS